MNAWRFAIKHTVAAGIVVGGFVLFTAATYFTLLLWAVLTGGSMGGPLAFPFLLVFALVAGAGTVLLVLLPATAVAEWLCQKRRLQAVFQIPLATLLLAVDVLAVAVAIAVMRGASVRAASLVAVWISAVLLVPLGAYWWSLQSTDWLIGVGMRWSNELKRRSPGSRHPTELRRGDLDEDS